MAGRRNDEGGIDRIRIHTRLIVVVHGDQCPVRHDARQTDPAVIVDTSDEILDGRGIEQLDIRKLEDFGQEGGGEQGRVLHDHEARMLTIIFVRDAKFSKESVGGLSHDHRTEELAPQPGASAWCNTSLDDGNFQVWTGFGENEGGRESTTARPDDNLRLISKRLGPAVGKDGEKVNRSWCCWSRFFSFKKPFESSMETLVDVQTTVRLPSHRSFWPMQEPSQPYTDGGCRSESRHLDQ